MQRKQAAVQSPADTKFLPQSWTPNIAIVIITISTVILTTTNIMGSAFSEAPELLLVNSLEGR